MTKLETLVPPLEYCKLIPQGEFADSALMWIDPQNMSCVLDHISYLRITEPYILPRTKINAVNGIPAPTLQEIMEKLEQFSVSCFGKGYQTEAANGWNAVSDDTATTAALKLYLQLKGIVSDQSEKSDQSTPAEKSALEKAIDIHEEAYLEGINAPAESEVNNG